MPDRAKPMPGPADASAIKLKNLAFPLQSPERRRVFHDYYDTADRTAGIRGGGRGWEGGDRVVPGGAPRRSGRWGAGSVRRGLSARDLAGTSASPCFDGC